MFVFFAQSGSIGRTLQFCAGMEVKLHARKIKHNKIEFAQTCDRLSTNTRR